MLAPYFLQGKFAVRCIRQLSLLQAKDILVYLAYVEKYIISVPEMHRLYLCWHASVADFVPRSISVNRHITYLPQGIR